MGLGDVAVQLTLEPVKLFDEMVCTLLMRCSFSPGAAILTLSLLVCLLTAPLRPRRFSDLRGNPRRWVLLLILDRKSVV